MKAKVFFTITDNGKKHNGNATIYGRTREELQARVNRFLEHHTDLIIREVRGI